MNAISKQYSSHNQKITMHKPLPKSKRIKVHIPYPLKDERTAFKKLNTSFYHPTQKLWSIVNTEENKAELKRLFKEKLEIKIITANTVYKT